MQTDRRRFITRSLLSLGGITALGSVSRASVRQEPVRAGAPVDDEEAWVESLRQQIPASTHSRYFQTAGIGPCPSSVIAEVETKLAFQNQSPADPLVSEAMNAIEPRLRKHLAASLGADTNEVALTHSTSEGINIVSWSLPFDETLLSWTGSHSHATMDYSGNYTLKPDASRFEFGSRALATFAGFEEALSFWDRLGWDRALARTRFLVDHAIERIDASEKLELSSPRNRAHRSAIVTLRLPDGTDARALYDRLRQDEGILASPVRDDRDFRLAIHCFNTRDDVDEALAAIERHV